MADFNTLRQQVTMMQVAEMLGIRLNREQRSSCPICSKGDNRVFRVFPKTNTFWCYEHKRSGDIIGLVAAAQKCDEKTAGNRIAEHFNIHAPRPAERNSAANFNAADWGKCLDPEHEALAPFGISADTYRAFGAGYNAGKPSLKGMLCIPVRDPTGTPQCFVGVDPQTLDYVFPKGVESPTFLNVDRINGGQLVVVTHPLELLRQLDAGIEELTNSIAIIVPITPDILASLATIARERGVESIEFH